MVETDVLRRSVRVDRISRNVGDWNHLLDMSLGQGGTYELLTFDRAGMVPRTATGRMLLMHANQGGGLMSQNAGLCRPGGSRADRRAAVLALCLAALLNRLAHDEGEGDVARCNDRAVHARHRRELRARLGVLQGEGVVRRQREVRRARRLIAARTGL